MAPLRGAIMEGGSERPPTDEHPWPWLTIHGDGAMRVKKVNKKAPFSINSATWGAILLPYTHDENDCETANLRDSGQR